MHPNARLITDFYTAFQRRDAAGMAGCYRAEIQFSDPVFPALSGTQVTAMWQMLLARSEELRLVFDGVEADDRAGRAQWIATYPFSKTGRTVVNEVSAQFAFQDGLIIRHADSFDFWRWSRMALGPAGLVLGWSSALRSKVRAEAAAALAKWIAAHPQVATAG